MKSAKNLPKSQVNRSTYHLPRSHLAHKMNHMPTLVPRIQRGQHSSQSSQGQNKIHS